MRAGVGSLGIVRSHGKCSERPVPHARIATSRIYRNSIEIHCNLRFRRKYVLPSNDYTYKNS